MTPLAIEDYLDDYHVAPEVMENGQRLIEIINTVLAAAELDGVPLEANPLTRNYIAGNGNGGVRLPDSPVGAARSAHKRGTAIDLYDPHRSLAAWAWANKPRLELLGIRSMERPEYTPTWVHLSSESVASGVFAFIPHGGRPIADPLPEQVA